VHGSRQIAIGAVAAGVFADSHDTCFIGSIDGEPTGDAGSSVAVFIDSNNNLGTVVSSRRYKHDVKPMDKASEVILALKPVTFKYNSDVKGTPCFGLIAEDVAQVDRDLVVRDKNGELQTVRYEQINAMLLNEFLKEHNRVEEQQASIGQLKSEMQTMVAQLKEQAAQIQKVSAQLEVNKPAPKMVTNKP
jgi:methyl-accepting chemotaxis protein